VEKGLEQGRDLRALELALKAHSFRDSFSTSRRSEGEHFKGRKTDQRNVARDSRVLLDRGALKKEAGGRGGRKGGKGITNGSIFEVY